MKTILNLKQYVILLVAAFAMTSCLDSDDPDFQFIGGGGYIIQVTPTTFFPMIAAYIMNLVATYIIFVAL